MLNVKREFLTVLRESTRYLQEEVEYCFQNFREDGSPCERAFLKRAEILRSELSSLWSLSAEKGNREGSLEAIWALGNAQFRLTRIPRPLFEISQSTSNLRGLAQVDSSRHHLLPMRSVHPYYSSSYLSIECFAQYYNRLSEAIFPKTFRPETPLVDTWTSEEYAWEPSVPHVSDVETPLIHELQGKHIDLRPFHARIRNELNMTTIRVPRWACQQLRKVGGLLPHEFFHRIMGVVNGFVVRDLNYVAEEGIEEEEYLPALQKIYGEHIAELSRILPNLMGKLVRRVYSRLLEPEIINQGYEPTVWAVAEEILCDAFAYYLVGDTYVLSLGSEVFPQILQSYAPVEAVVEAHSRDREGSRDRLREFYLDLQHPHPSIRLMILMRIAGMFQDSKSLEQLNEYFNVAPKILTWRDGFPCLSDQLLDTLDCDDFLRGFADFVQSSDFDASVREVFVLLEEAGVLNFFGKLGLGRGHMIELHKMRERLLEELTENPSWNYEKLFGSEFNPTHILGAIWEAKKRGSDDSDLGSLASGNQTAWRLYLEYYLTAKYGGITG